MSLYDMNRANLDVCHTCKMIQYCHVKKIFLGLLSSESLKMSYLHKFPIFNFYHTLYVYKPFNAHTQTYSVLSFRKKKQS